jgi:hypothetical protein
MQGVEHGIDARRNKHVFLHVFERELLPETGLAKLLTVFLYLTGKLKRRRVRIVPGKELARSPVELTAERPVVGSHVLQVILQELVVYLRVHGFFERLELGVYDFERLDYMNEILGMELLVRDYILGVE